MGAWHLFQQWFNLNCPISISFPRWTLWETKSISKSAFLFQHPCLSCLFELFSDLIILSVYWLCSFLNPEAQILLSDLNQHMAPQFTKLNKALAELVSYQEDMDLLHSFIYLQDKVNNSYTHLNILCSFANLQVKCRKPIINAIWWLFIYFKKQVGGLFMFIHLFK